MKVKIFYKNKDHGFMLKVRIIIIGIIPIVFKINARS